MIIGNTHASRSMSADHLLQLHDAIADIRRRTIFFIGGLPKSGTTWLQLLLDAHPDIRCRGEGHFCNSLQSLLETALLQHNSLIEAKNIDLQIGFAPHPTFTEAHRHYMLVAGMALLLAEGAGTASIIGEKTPDNVLNLPRILELFPAARFVIIVRDGRDCAVSAWYHNLRVDPDGARVQFPHFDTFVGSVARVWASGVEAGERFMAANPDICHTITYEGLSAAPAETVAGVLRFLGAEAAPSTVRACVRAADFTQLTGGRRRGEEDVSSMFRSGVVGGWKRHFDAAALAAFMREAAPQLRQWCYA
jgi:Sulfotransferase family